MINLNIKFDFMEEIFFYDNRTTHVSGDIWQGIPILSFITTDLKI